ncbi:MAG TPA: pentapeptide repeat-containing protein, partial [Rhodospirillales bacterium]|nr:pentapeptide repeat-containing protein [Rhodospirillales bacterium]
MLATLVQIATPPSNNSKPNPVIPILETFVNQKMDISGLPLPGVNLQGANLKGAKLKGADLKGANLKGADL